MRRRGLPHGAVPRGGPLGAGRLVEARPLNPLSIFSGGATVGGRPAHHAQPPTPGRSMFPARDIARGAEGMNQPVSGRDRGPRPASPAILVA